MAAIVVQVMGNFIPDIFQNPMFHDVIGVRLRLSVDLEVPIVLPGVVKLM
jgi:hypothetical protein